MEKKGSKNSTLFNAIACVSQPDENKLLLFSAKFKLLVPYNDLDNFIFVLQAGIHWGVHLYVTLALKNNALIVYTCLLLKDNFL